jgi:thermostable 8-oxoguanine DNA glycosylase
MKENEIAEKYVIPYLENLGFSKFLITQYGKVPVQMGTEVKWADIVTFIIENESAVPYLVVEVKTKLNDLNQILAQTDSYSKLLDTSYFVVTDGQDYLSYQRRPTGGYIKISNIPIPENIHLTVTQDTKFRPGFLLCAKLDVEKSKQIGLNDRLFDKIDDYFNLMMQNRYYLGNNNKYSLRNDMIWHYFAIKKINNFIFQDIETLRPEDFKTVFENNIMCGRPANKKHIFSEVDCNFEKVKSFLTFIKEFKGDPEENLNTLLDAESELHINGMGPFLLSQFLAGAHPREYTIIQDQMVETMKDLQLIDTKVKSDTPKGYLYINEICKELYNDYFSKKIYENQNKLGFKIDRDFSLVVIHEFFWEYNVFNSYDVTRLEEAIGERLNSEEELTNQILKELNALRIHIQH